MLYTVSVKENKFTLLTWLGEMTFLNTPSIILFTGDCETAHGRWIWARQWNYSKP